MRAWMSGSLLIAYACGRAEAPMTPSRALCDSMAREVDSANEIQAGVLQELESAEHARLVWESRHDGDARARVSGYTSTMLALCETYDLVRDDMRASARAVPASEAVAKTHPNDDYWCYLQFIVADLDAHDAATRRRFIDDFAKLGALAARDDDAIVAACYEAAGIKRTVGRRDSSLSLPSE